MLKQKHFHIVNELIIKKESTELQMKKSNKWERLMIKRKEKKKWKRRYNLTKVMLCTVIAECTIINDRTIKNNL